MRANANLRVEANSSCNSYYQSIGGLSTKPRHLRYTIYDIRVEPALSRTTHVRARKSYVVNVVAAGTFANRDESKARGSGDSAARGSLSRARPTFAFEL